MKFRAFHEGKLGKGVLMVRVVGLPQIKECGGARLGLIKHSSLLGVESGVRSILASSMIDSIQAWL